MIARLRHFLSKTEGHIPERDTMIVVSQRWPPNFQDTDADVWIIPKGSHKAIGAECASLVFTKNKTGWTGWEDNPCDGGPTFAALKDKTMIMVEAIYAEDMDEVMALIARLDPEGEGHSIEPALADKIAAIPPEDRDKILEAFGLLDEYLEDQAFAKEREGTTIKSILAPIKRLISLDN